MVLKNKLVTAGEMVRIVSQKYCKEKRENRLMKRVIVETLKLNTSSYARWSVQKLKGAPAHHNNTQYTHRTIPVKYTHTQLLTHANTHQIKY
jgi:patatin-like phospholipase/acyl hydrolase